MGVAACLTCIATYAMEFPHLADLSNAAVLKTAIMLGKILFLCNKELQGEFGVRITLKLQEFGNKVRIWKYSHRNRTCRDVHCTMYIVHTVCYIFIKKGNYQKCTMSFET